LALHLIDREYAELLPIEQVIERCGIHLLISPRRTAQHLRRPQADADDERLTLRQRERALRSIQPPGAARAHHERSLEAIVFLDIGLARHDTRRLQQAELRQDAHVVVDVVGGESELARELCGRRLADAPQLQQYRATRRV